MAALTWASSGGGLVFDGAGSGGLRSSIHRVGLVLLVLALALAVVALPFAIASMVGSLRHPLGADAFHLSTPASRQRATTALNIRLVAIDEVNQNVTLAITGDRHCTAACGAGQILSFFALHADPRGSDGAPPSQDVGVPADGEFDASVVLPITGSLGAYPFDRYQLVLGLAVTDKVSSTRIVPLPARVARRQLDVSVDEILSRIDLATPRDVTSRYRFVGAQVALAAPIDLSRPLYLQALTVLIIIFIAIAGVYSVVTRAFKEVIGTVGVVVLGVWGVRTLLVGSYPPDSTAVDLILVLLILLLLTILLVRGLVLMWRRIHDGPGGPGGESPGRQDSNEQEEEADMLPDLG